MTLFLCESNVDAIFGIYGTINNSASRKVLLLNLLNISGNLKNFRISEFQEAVSQQDLLISQEFHILIKQKQRKESRTKQFFLGFCSHCSKIRT
jgi:hypothetical protein